MKAIYDSRQAAVVITMPVEEARHFSYSGVEVKYTQHLVKQALRQAGQQSCWLGGNRTDCWLDQTKPRVIRFASAKQVKKASRWAVKKYAAVFKKLAQFTN